MEHISLWASVRHGKQRGRGGIWQKETNKWERKRTLVGSKNSRRTVKLREKWYHYPNFICFVSPRTREIGREMERQKFWWFALNFTKLNQLQESSCQKGKNCIPQNNTMSLKGSFLLRLLKSISNKSAKVQMLTSLVFNSTENGHQKSFLFNKLVR